MNHDHEVDDDDNLEVIVELSLLFCCCNADDDDSEESTIRNQWEQLVTSVGCRAATSSGTDSADADKSTTATAVFMERNVFKYVKWQDKYMAMASTLLKSRAFYQTFHPLKSMTTKRQVRPLVNLPRTQHQKPYIPCHNKNNKSQQSDECCFCYPISISHQFPFVGIARQPISIEKKSSPSSQPKQQQRLLLGLDIVIFEYSQRIFQNAVEFVDTFCDSFSTTEWKSLTKQHDGLLQEFFLRWAAKEAYTKALGLGLGMEFSSFHIAFETESLWQLLLGSVTTAAGHEYVSVPAPVVWVNRDCADRDSADDVWLFTLHPLFDNDNNQKLESSTSKTADSIQGCACTCIGPFHNRNGKHLDRSLRLEVHWTTVESLIAWHTNSDIVS